MKDAIEIGKHSFLHDFLISPKYRHWRHIFLVSGLAVISSNQVFIAYQGDVGLLGYQIYWICLGALLPYLTIIYFSLYVLAPKLLLKNKYTLYISILSILVLFLLFQQLVQEYFIRSALGLPHRLDSYTNPVILIDSLSSFMISLICAMGTSSTVLLKRWMIENRRVNQLEKIHVKSEVEQLKAQVNPEFLSNVLNKAGALARTDPRKSSAILMKLSQLLRYQLYDCSREAVLLSSEISFITNYLALAQMCSGGFEYSVTIKGISKATLIPPLLFTPFIQHEIKQTHKEKSLIHVEFESAENSVVFACTMNNKDTAFAHEHQQIEQRLTLLYGDNFSLSITEDRVKLNVNILEQW